MICGVCWKVVWGAGWPCGHVCTHVLWVRTLAAFLSSQQHCTLEQQTEHHASDKSLTVVMQAALNTMRITPDSAVGGAVQITSLLISETGQSTQSKLRTSSSLYAARMPENPG